MHKTQRALLELSENQDIGGLSLRKISSLIGGQDKAQTIKYHLIQLQKSGLILMDFKGGIIKSRKRGICSENLFYSVPIVNGANCTLENLFSNEKIVGYLKFSKKFFLEDNKNLYAIISDKDGSIALIDSSFNSPDVGDVVVFVMGGEAVIRTYNYDKIPGYITLDDESSPNTNVSIMLHPDDVQEYVDKGFFCGKVVKVFRSKD